MLEKSAVISVLFIFHYSKIEILQGHVLDAHNAPVGDAWSVSDSWLSLSNSSCMWNPIGVFFYSTLKAVLF